MRSLIFVGSALLTFAAVAQAQEWKVTSELTESGIDVHFPETLDTQSAADADNWTVEATGKSGQRERLKVKSVSIGTDDRSVSIEVEGLKASVQLTVHFAIKSADGRVHKGSCAVEKKS